MGLQKRYNLDVDGNFGPTTRIRIKEIVGLNFEQACMAVPGTTKFRQPNGPDLEWSRDLLNALF